MNVLGHAYVAFKTVGRLNKYSMAGSHLPDLVPFVPNSVFTFEEIHESPEKMLRFLEKKYPHARDLALGMMSHSAKYGADKFNREIEEWLLGNNKSLKDELVLRIVNCCSLDLRTATREGLLHNSLWGGIDIYLLKTKLETVKKLAEAHQGIDHQEIADLLAEFFKKDEKEVERMIDYFLEPVKPENLVSVGGLVRIWKKHAAGLPEKIMIDEERPIQLIKKIYSLFEDQWEGILARVVADVKRNLKPFVFLSPPRRSTARPPRRCS